MFTKRNSVRINQKTLKLVAQNGWEGEGKMECKEYGRGGDT